MPNKPSLFNEVEAMKPEAWNVYEGLEKAIQPLIQEFGKQFSRREIAAIAHSVVENVIALEVIKGRLRL